MTGGVIASPPPLRGPDGQADEEFLVLAPLEIHKLHGNIDPLTHSLVSRFSAFVPNPYLLDNHRFILYNLNRYCQHKERKSGLEQS